MSRLDRANLAAFSDAILALHAPEGGEFWQRMLTALRALISSDINAYNEFGAGGEAHIVLDPEPLPGHLFDAFQAHRMDHANLRHLMEVTTEKAIKFSDFYRSSEWQKTGLYNEFFAPLGLTHQIAGGFPISGGAIIAFALNRQKRDFTENDRVLLDLLRPHLMQAWQHGEAWKRAHAALHDVAALHCTRKGVIVFSTARADELLARYFGSAASNALPEELRQWLCSAQADRFGESLLAPPPYTIERPGGRLVARLGPITADGTYEVSMEEKGLRGDPSALRALGLTKREGEVLFWLARGKTSPEIAVILGSATGTVTKHLEHIYAKLGVETRTAAAAVALELL